MKRLLVALYLGIASLALAQGYQPGNQGGTISGGSVVGAGFNSLTVSGSTTGNPTTAKATGGDANVGINLVTTGSGSTSLLSNSYLGLDGSNLTPAWGLRYNSGSTRIEFRANSGLAAQIDNGQNFSGLGLVQSSSGGQNNAGLNGCGSGGCVPQLYFNGADTNVNGVLQPKGNGIICANNAANCTTPNVYIASATPYTLDSFYVNAAIPAGAQTYGKIILPARPFTVTAITYETSVAAVGAGTHTWQFTDGTNICNCAVNCTAETANAAVRQASCTNAGGAGCAFPNTQTTISYTTLSSTCATSQATVLGNVRIEGNWQ